MNELLTTIQEVRECGQHNANHYLSHGYVLLDIQSSSRGQKFSGEHVSGQQYYVRRNPIYVLGRPEAVESVPPLPRWTPPKEDEGA